MSYPFARQSDLPHATYSRRFLRRWGGLIRRRQHDIAAAQREEASKVKLTFDALEPRLLLNADLSVNLTTEGPDRTNEVIVRMVEEIDLKLDAATPVKRVEVVDLGDSGRVIASQLINPTSLGNLTIIGSQGNDRVTIDVDSFGDASLPNIIFQGRGGNDTLYVSRTATAGNTAATEWNITDNNGGTVTVPGQGGLGGTITFTGTENLQGSHFVDDTFTFSGTSLVTGLVDGGLGGRDGLAIAGITGVDFTANGSGRLMLGASHLAFANMEPFASLTDAALPGLRVIDRSQTAALSGALNFIAQDGQQFAAIGGTQLAEITGADKLWLYFGDTSESTRNISIADLGVFSGSTLMLDGFGTVAVNGTVTASGKTIGISARDITVETGATITAENIYLAAVDGASGRNLFTQSAAHDALASLVVDGNLHADAALNLSAYSFLNQHVTYDADSMTIGARSATDALTTSNIARLTVGAAAVLQGGTVTLAANAVSQVTKDLRDVILPNVAGIVDVAASKEAIIAALIATLPADSRLAAALGQLEQGSKIELVTALTEALLDGSLSTDNLSGMYDRLVNLGQLESPRVSALANMFATIKSTINLTNTAIVTVNGTLNSGQATQITADSDVRASTRLRTATENGLISALDGIAILGAMTSAMTVDQAALITLTGGVDAGEVRLAAQTQGLVENRVMSRSMGATRVTMTEATQIDLRGTSGITSQSGIAIRALADTTTISESLDAITRATGQVSVNVATDLTAEGGSLSITALNASDFMAMALPFANDIGDHLSLRVSRSSAINDIDRTTAITVSAGDLRGATGMTLRAITQADVTAFVGQVPPDAAPDTVAGSPTIAKTLVAGGLAMNIVNGHTLVTIAPAVDQSVVLRANTGNIDIKAINESFVDATVYANIEGRGGSSGYGGKNSATAIGGAVAINVSGFTVPHPAAAALDALLGTTFFTNETQSRTAVAISDATLNAIAGQVILAGLSRGVSNVTITNVIRNEVAGSTAAKTKVIGVAFASNQLSQLADVWVRNTTLSATQGVSLEAQDTAVINSNVTLISSGVAATDGGIHKYLDMMAGGAAADVLLTQGDSTQIAHGIVVGLDHDIVTNGYEGKLAVEPGSIVLHRDKFGTGTLYQYIGTADRVIDLENAADQQNAYFTNTNLWRKISGVPGKTYTYMGTATTLDLATTDFTDKSLWKAEPDSRSLTDEMNLRTAGATAIGLAIAMNDLRNGARAGIEGGRVNGGLQVKALSDGAIFADIDVTSETEGGGAFAQDDLLSKYLSFPKNYQLGSHGSTKSMSLIIATNVLLGTQGDNIVGTIASVSGTTINAGQQDVTVAAQNASLIQAHNSAVAMTEGGSSAIALQVANNTIGFARGNLLFNTIETILGDVIPDNMTPDVYTPLDRTQTPVEVKAGLSGVTIESVRNLSVTADNKAKIDARSDNSAKAAVSALFDGKATSIGVAITGNKISNGAVALISDTVIAGAQNISVVALSRAEITALSEIGASAAADNSGGANIINNLLNTQREDYAFTELSGAQDVKFGDKVRVAAPDGTATYYAFMGSDRNINLSSADYADRGLWKVLNTDSLIPTAIIKRSLQAVKFQNAGVGFGLGNDAKVISGIITRNEVISGASAQIVRSEVQAAGAVTISASSAGLISSHDRSAVDAGSNLVLISVTNNLRGGTTAGVSGGKVEAGSLSVAAKSTAKITSRAEGDVKTSDTTAMAVTPPNPGGSTGSGSETAPITASGKAIVLSFNAIGYKPTNLIFDALETVFGTSEATEELFDTANPIDSTAFIRGTEVNVAGATRVTADTASEITSFAGNSVATTIENNLALLASDRVSGMSAAVVLASNRIYGKAKAEIADAPLFETGTLDVSSRNSGRVDSRVDVESNAAASATLGDLGALVDGLADRMGLTGYSFTDESGLRQVHQGDRVLFSQATGTHGTNNILYEFLGEDPTQIDLSAENFTNAARWKAIATADLRDILDISALNIRESDARAVGIIFAVNTVRGGAETNLSDVVLTASGSAVAISAQDDAAITSYVSSTARAAGGSTLTGGGSVATLQGQIATNVVLGGAKTTLADVDMTATDSAVSISAKNESKIDARIFASGASEGDAKAVTLAFNAIGYTSQNVIFDLVDTVVGMPLLAGSTTDSVPYGFSTATPAHAEVAITGATKIRANTIDIQAENAARTNATVSNAATVNSSAIKGTSGSAFGIVAASNKIASEAVVAVRVRMH